jgi:hypothetical protein
MQAITQGHRTGNAGLERAERTQKSLFEVEGHGTRSPVYHPPQARP